MSAHRVAVWLGSYGGDFKDALPRAVRDGFRCIHADALRGTLCPDELSGTGRRHLVKFVGELGAALDGLGLEFPRAGLAEACQAESRLARVRQTVALARDLGARRVIVRVGGFEDDQPNGLAREVLGELADMSDRAGVIIAVQVADGRTAAAAPHVRSFGCATLMMAVDTLDTPDPDELQPSLAGLIGSATLRDVRRRGAAIEQTDYGAGDVDFARLTATLDQCGCCAPLVLRGNSGDAATVRKGREYLETLLAPSA